MNHTRAASTRTPIVSGRRRGRVGGFTLVELMITIALAAVLITIAVPSFKHVIASTKLTSTANALVSSMHVARMQAIKRNAGVQFCSNSSGDNGSDTLGSACGTDAGAVYVLVGPASAASAVRVRAATGITQGQQQLDGDIVPLRFTPQGLAHALNQTAPYAGVVADICTDAISSDNHRVIHMVAGSIIHVESTDGACP